MPSKSDIASDFSHRSGGSDWQRGPAAREGAVDASNGGSLVNGRRLKRRLIVIM